MGFYGIIIMIIFFYLIIDYFNKINKEEEDDELNYSRRLSTEVATPNRAEENEADDLPPYTPPTPKTKAAMADLPPSYDETMDISEVRVPMNNTSYMVNNDGSNVNINTNTNNNVNMPPPCAVNPYTMNNNVNSPYGYPYYNVPEIVIDPMNNRTTTVV